MPSPSLPRPPPRALAHHRASTSAAAPPPAKRPAPGPSAPRGTARPVRAPPPAPAWRFGAAAHPGTRPYMEDRHVVLADYGGTGGGRSFVGVYDGHSGPDAAVAAAERLHLHLAAQPALWEEAWDAGGGDAASASPPLSGVTAALVAAFRATDADILAAARARGGRQGAAALVAMLAGDVLWTAHAGDARAVLARDGGARAHRLTADHKPDAPAERGRILAAGGRVQWHGCARVVCAGRAGRPAAALAVSRSLGDLDFKEPHRLVSGDPEVGVVRLTPGDAFLLLASDGLWDVVSDQAAVDVAAAALAAATARAAADPAVDPPAEAAAALVAEAGARRSGDNVSVVVCQRV